MSPLFFFNDWANNELVCVLRSLQKCCEREREGVRGRWRLINIKFQCLLTPRCSGSCKLVSRRAAGQHVVESHHINSHVGSTPRHFQHNPPVPRSAGASPRIDDWPASEGKQGEIVLKNNIYLEICDMIAISFFSI